MIEGQHEKPCKTILWAEETFHGTLPENYFISTSPVNGARVEACRSRLSDQSLTLVASLAAVMTPLLIWRICSPALVNWLLRNSDWICIAC